METYLIAARFIHFAAVTLIFGGALFSLYAGNAGWRLLAGRNLRVWLASGAAVAMFSAILWGDAVAATMSGSWIGASDPQLLGTVLLNTAFGRVWLWRFVLAVVLFAMLVSWRGAQATSVARLFTVMLTGLLAATLGGVGHAVMLTGGWAEWLIAAQAVHVLAASAWLGGLIPLALVLRHVRSVTNTNMLNDLVTVLSRFSVMGVVVVGAIAATGIGSALLIIRDFHALFSTPYGGVLIAKIFVFFLMIGIAADNRWRLTAQIRNSAKGLDVHSAADHLARNIAIEIGFGILVLALVAVLGTFSPG